MMAVLLALLAYSFAPLILVTVLAMHLADWASQQEARSGTPYITRPQCMTCHYDLRGSMVEAGVGGESGERIRTGRFCPECGAELDDAHVAWVPEEGFPRLWRLRQAGAWALALGPVALGAGVIGAWESSLMHEVAVFLASAMGFVLLLGISGALVCLHVRLVVRTGIAMDSPRSQRLSSNLFAVAMSLDAGLVMTAFTLAGFLALTR